MGLFDNSEILTDRTFSWALGPYFTPPTDLEEFPEDVSKISLFVDEQGTINVDEQLYLYKKSDPIDALYGSEINWSESNGFIKSLEPLLGVPVFSVISYPWYDVRHAAENNGEIKPIKFPNSTPEGFWPCNGYIVKIAGKQYRLPNLVSRTITTGAGDGASSSTTYLAPPGHTFMMKLPGGKGDATEISLFGEETNVAFTGELRTWGNPENPFVFRFL